MQPSMSKNELISSLQGYASLLEERNAALIQLTVTSSEIRSALQSDVAANIDEALERRDRDCKRYAALCDSTRPSNQAIAEAVSRVARNAGDEAEKLARSVLSLYADSQTLADEILKCQSECEVILKSRLKATSKALRESTQRRKLDAVYGPAHRHSTPTYLDKQR